MAQKVCSFCHGMSPNWKKLCYTCGNKGRVFVPDPTHTIIIISYPKTPEQEHDMFEKLQRFKNHKPIRILSSVAPKPTQVATRIGLYFKTRVELFSALKAGKDGLQKNAVYSLAKADRKLGVLIFVTHTPIVRLSREVFYSKINGVSHPEPIDVVSGDIIHIFGTSISKL